MLQSCIPGQPAAQIPKWHQELRNSYITGVQDQPVQTADDVIKAIAKARLDKLLTLKITFSTIVSQALHPQLGIPQLYHDQMNIIRQHLSNMNYDPPPNHAPHISQMKKCPKLTCRVLLQQDDWPNWKASEFKQLDQYETQQTFGPPQTLPPGANILNLLWTYLIKDCRTKKACCICNSSPKFQGSVTMAEMYAPALDQTGACIFWAASALYNFVTISADVSNTFTEYILYLCTILAQIGLEQESATILYKDNQGALLMAEARKPTKRTRHMDIKHFAIQQWVERNLIQFKRISTHDNTADAMTKAIPRTLFYCHMNHIMGQIIPSYAKYLNQQRNQQLDYTSPPKHICVSPAIETLKQGGMLEG